MHRARNLLMVVCLGVLPAAWPAHAQDQASAQAARVPAGNLIELADGRVVRLAGIRLPAEAGPDLFEQARSALAALVEGRTVRLEPVDAAHDRHGRLVAQGWRDDGLWLQGALLDAGLVQVQTRPGEVALAAEMAALEGAARRAQRGLWRDATFAPQLAEKVAALVGGFRIVEGRVRRVAPTERYIYLNFGTDWRTDFTLRVARSVARSFRKAGIELEQLAGREVEVRGYVLEAGGPLIELSHPEQIRIGPDIR